MPHDDPIFDEATSRVLAAMEPDTAKRFDPATIMLIITVIINVIKSCQDKSPETIRDTAKAGGIRGIFTRWAVRRRAADAIKAEYGDRDAIGAWKFRELRDTLADATIEAARTAGPDELGRLMLAVAAKRSEL